jgi:signal peptide peptidase SppA
MIRSLPHILALAFGPPLLIEPKKLDALLVGLHAALQHRGSLLGEGEQRLDIAMIEGDGSTPVDERPRGYRIQNGVATLPVHGVLVRRAGQMTPDSTMLQSYENVGRVLRNAQRDSRVRGILLDIDSPGGEAGGVFDLAKQIRHAATTKPIWSIANDDSLSAAYVLASATDRVWATQTAALGSLGVVALHADQSAFDAEEGIKYTYVYRGARKIDAHPHAALTAEASLAIQSEVDRLYDKLVGIVAEHRHTQPERIRGTEAAVYFGERALNQGLADRIGTIDEAHAALVDHTAPKGARMDQTTTQPPTGATSSAEPMPPAPPPADNVVPLARVADAETRARGQAVEIAELCKLAGLADLAGDFIGANLTADAVRAELQKRQAADSAKRPLVAIDTAPKPRDAATVSELAKAHAARVRAMYGR